MSAYTAKDIARAFRGVRSHTIQIANEIPEDKYGVSGAPGTRTVAQLLTHMALAPRFTRALHSGPRESLDFRKIMGELAAEEAKPRMKADIVALLQSEGEAFATWVESLSEAFLAEQLPTMPAGQIPASKSRLEMLLSPKEHEMHHRAQLMLIERQLGIVPHLTRARQEAMAAAAARA